MTFLSLFEFSKILPSLASSLECLPTLTPHPLTHLTVFPILLPTLSSPPSTLHHPLPTCLIYQQLFILFTFSLLCNLVSVPFWISQFQPQLWVVLFLHTYLNCQHLPLSLHFLSLLFTQLYCPSNALFPIFKSSSPLPSPPSSVTFPPVLPISSNYFHFPFLPVSSSFIDSFQFTMLLPVCYLNPLLLTHSQPPLFFFPFHYLTFLSFSSPSPLPTNLAYQ